MKSIRSQRTANHDVEKSTTPDLLAGQTRDWTPVQPETLDAESESFGSPTPCRESSPEIANEEKDAKVLPTLDFIFDTGNIRILVKLNDIVREGRVSSSSMIQASPVWRKLLSPTQDEDVEELRHSIKRIDCTEDDSEALLILLNICHLNFQEVPHGVGYELLLLLALLCDKYDCVSLVQPWLTNERWLMQESEESMLPGKEGWLRIAQIFELEVVFDKLVKHMARNVYGSIGDADADHATESLTLVPHDIKRK